MFMTFTKHRLWVAGLALLLGLFFMPQHAFAAAITVDLCATTGTISVPGNPSPVSIPVWGYAPGNCSDSPTAMVPGPEIRVNEGDEVTVNLYNNLGETTGIVFQGQAMVPDLTGVAGLGPKIYSFTASQPGAFLYEAGLIPGTQHQPAMGLYGALIVESATAGQAYGAASTAFSVEKVLVLSEIDPALNTSATPSTFDLRNIKPRYGLINGKAFPDTNTDPINVVAGDQLLLRYVNAGLQFHSMALLGAHQTVIAMDGSPLTYSHRMVAETIAPGQTADAIVPISASAQAGTKYALYEGDFQLHNSNAAAMGGIIPKDPSPANAVGYGGMLTFVNVGVPGGGGPDATGPETTNVTVTPNPTTGASGVTLGAVISDAATGGNGEADAEYFIDTVGADGNGTHFTPNTPLAIGAGILNGLLSGNHTIYVHGQDGLGNWGPTNFVVLNLDKSGPVSTALLLNPNPTNGSADVTLTATANDTASGNGNIQAAEYYIGAAGAGGSGTPMSLNTTSAPIASASATIAAATVAGMSEGANPIFVRSQDALGNWGDATQIDLIVDKTGPNTTAVSVDPSPNNGQDSVRVDASIVDAPAEACPVVAASMPDLSAATIYMPLVGGGANSGSTDTATSVVAAAVTSGVRAIERAEGFIDTPGADGTGFVLAASDGAFNCTSEEVTALIPLATILQLSDGPHTINVHAQDNAGNWGGYSSTPLLLPPPAAGFYFSTLGNTNPPSVGGAADNSDIYNWAGASYTRLWDATAHGVAGGENVDGLAMVDATHFYLSLDTNASLAGIGTAFDEDVVYYDNGTWSLFFDGSAHGLPNVGNADLDAVDVTGGILYFSTLGNVNPPGAGGAADDADIYRWNGGSSYTRIFDASANGLPGGANIDGLTVVNVTHFYVSFTGNVTVSGLGTVQDEDVVEFNSGAWSVYFDGTSHGLNTSDNLDVDALDVP